MKAQKNRVIRPDMGPCGKCGYGAVEVLTVDQDGIIGDGDDVVCPQCGALGALCGAPSDGIGVDWDFYNDDEE